MIIEKLDNENNRFKSNFEKNLIPQIEERLENGENKIDYTESEIREILEVSYTLDNLYTRFKSLLLNSQYGISIKRIPNNSKFLFFRKLNGINRESDLFKIKFELIIPKIEDGLKNVKEVAFEEKYFKLHLDTTSSIDNIYHRIRDILLNKDLHIKIEKNVIVDNESINLLIFYYRKSLIEKKEIENINKEIIKKNKELEKKDAKDRELKLKKMEEEDLRKLENARENDIFIEELLKQFPPPPWEVKSEKVYEAKEILQKKVENKPKKIEIEVNDDGSFLCIKCKNIVKYHDSKCSQCGEEYNWKSIDK